MFGSESGMARSGSATCDDCLREQLVTGSGSRECSWAGPGSLLDLGASLELGEGRPIFGEFRCPFGVGLRLLALDSESLDDELSELSESDDEEPEEEDDDEDSERGLPWGVSIAKQTDMFQEVFASTLTLTTKTVTREYALNHDPDTLHQKT